MTLGASTARVTAAKPKATVMVRSVMVNAVISAATAAETERIEVQTMDLRKRYSFIFCP